MTKPPPEPVEIPDNVRRYTRWMMAAILVTIVLYVFNLPVSLASLVTAPAAFVLGILILVATMGHDRMGGIRVSAIAGMVLAMFAGLIALGSLVLYDVLIDLRECEARALTQTAKRECAVAYEEGYRGLLEDYGVTLP